MNKFLLGCVYFIFSFSIYAQIDANLNSSKDSSFTLSKDSAEFYNNIEVRINSLRMLCEKNSRLLENALLEKSFWDTICGTIILGLIIGILASIFVLFGDRYLNEYKLKKKFKYLEGHYRHTGKGVRPNCFSNFKYNKGGKFLINTTTDYGNWSGRILMDIDLAHIGGGTFN